MEESWDRRVRVAGKPFRALPQNTKRYMTWFTETCYSGGPGQNRRHPDVIVIQTGSPIHNNDTSEPLFRSINRQGFLILVENTSNTFVSVFHANPHVIDSPQKHFHDI